MVNNPTIRMNTALGLFALAVCLSACAPTQNANGKKLQTMTCAGEHIISFYEQREFDKKCIAYIERMRDAAPTE